MATTYVVPNSYLSLYDLKRLYLLTMLSHCVRYHPDKYCFECKMDIGVIGDRLNDERVSMFIHGYGSDPIDVIVDSPEEDFFKECARGH